MGKGINVQDILKSLPPGERREFADKLKREGGVEVAFTVTGKRRKRKHRWASAEGKVVAIRFTDGQYEVIARRAEARGLSPGDYLKWLSIRKHKKGVNDGRQDG